MAANVATETLYFTLDGTSALYMMDMRSGRLEYIANVGAPRELALDWSTGNVYVVDELTTPQLKVCRIKDNVCVQLFRFDYRDVVRAMVVDAVHGRVFYAAQPFAVSVVAQSVLYGHALDGSRRQVLVKEAGVVNALVCDVDKKRLFYADKSAASVWSVGYDGTGNRRMFARQEAVMRPVALALTEDQVYVFNEGSNVSVSVVVVNRKHYDFCICLILCYSCLSQQRSPPIARRTAIESANRLKSAHTTLTICSSSIRPRNVSCPTFVPRTIVVQCACPPNMVRSVCAGAVLL